MYTVKSGEPVQERTDGADGAYGTRALVDAMSRQDLMTLESAAKVLAEVTAPGARPNPFRNTEDPMPIVESIATRRREDDTLARVRRAGREEALWEVVSMANRAISECRSKGQDTSQLEEVRAAVRKLAGG